VPTNAMYPCPLFVLCDAPAYSKLCTQGVRVDACSTITVPKESNAASDFQFELHAEAAPSPAASTTFSDTIAVPLTTEVWLMGQQMAGVLACEFDGTSLTIKMA
jgi:hypothetical protein